MYNVQLSEAWKQRVGKETLYNAPSFDDRDDGSSIMSDQRSLAPSSVSLMSEYSRTKVIGHPRSMHAIDCKIGNSLIHSSTVS